MHVARAQPLVNSDSAADFLAHFQGMQLVDQDGKAWQADRVRGQMLVVNFVFTACSSTCPVQTQALVQVQQQLPARLQGQVQWLSVSLDPLSDTPKSLKTFAKRFGADTRLWSFITGRPRDIERLAEALWLFRSGKKKDQLDDHSTSLWLVDAQGALRLRLGGNPPQAAPLIQALSQLYAPVVGLRP